MSTNLIYGVVWGIPLWGDVYQKNVPNLLEEIDPIIGETTRYNSVTGKPYKIPQMINMCIPNFSFGEFKAGEKYDLNKIERFFNDYMHDKEENPSDYFVGTWSIIGVKAYKGEPPYTYVSDSFLALDLDIENAKKKWEEIFPEIPGQLLMYVEVNS